MSSPETPEDTCYERYTPSSIATIDTVTTPPPGVSGSSGVTVLETGTESLHARAWLGQHAQKTMDVQYFIFASDNLGLIALDYLVRAAERGVRVRLLVDDTLTHGDPLILLAANSVPNLEVKIYNPNLNIGKTLGQTLKNTTLNFKDVNQRMHNKSYTIDNKVSIIGGRNVANEYYDLDPEYNFRDRDLLMTGDVVQSVTDSFDLYWESELSVPIDTLISPDPAFDAHHATAALHAYSCDDQHFWPDIRDSISSFPSTIQYKIDHNQMVWTDKVHFFADLPGKNKEASMWGGGASTDMLIQVLINAKERLLLQTPYLIVSELGLGLFRTLEERGVEVIVQTNSLSSTDGVESFNGYSRNRKKLLEAGVEIYELNPFAEIRNELIESSLMSELPTVPRMGLHAKSMVVDGKILVVSSFNLDPRSANLNTELGVIIEGTTLPQLVEGLILEEIKPENSWHSTIEFNPSKSADFGKRVHHFFSYLIPLSVL
jgi:phosphatidylserine/phosphatidylglycerophosphate/cardiolipin synthase-like enzyme